MAEAFVSEAIVPLESSFDAAGMARGEPGVPLKFRWRGKEVTVAEVLETWKEHGDCSHGSGERYVRRHGFRVRTTEGMVLRLNFQRTFGRGKASKARWWINRVYWIKVCHPEPVEGSASRAYSTSFVDSRIAGG